MQFVIFLNFFALSFQKTTHSFTPVLVNNDLPIISYSGWPAHDTNSSPFSSALFRIRLHRPHTSCPASTIASHLRNLFVIRKDVKNIPLHYCPVTSLPFKISSHSWTAILHFSIFADPISCTSATRLVPFDTCLSIFNKSNLFPNTANFSMSCFLKIKFFELSAICNRNNYFSSLIVLLYLTANLLTSFLISLVCFYLAPSLLLINPTAQYYLAQTVIIVLVNLPKNLPSQIIQH